MAEATNGIQQMAMMMLNPQFAAQQQKFALQQQMAQEMMKQGSEEPPTAQLANPGGMVVRNSPWAALNRAVEKGVGAYSAQKAIGDQLAAAQNMNGQQAADQNAGGVGGGALLPWQTNMSTGLPQSQSMGNMMMGGNSDPKDPINDSSRFMDIGETMKAHYAYKADPEAYKVALRAAGGDPAKAAALLYGKAQADAIVTGRAGNMQTNMVNGKSNIIPKIPEGANASLNGNQVTGVSPIPITPAGGAQPNSPTPVAGGMQPMPPAPATDAPRNMDELLDQYSTPPKGDPTNVMPNPIPGTTPDVPPAAPVASNGTGYKPSAPITPQQTPLTPGGTQEQNTTGKAVGERDAAVSEAAMDAPNRIRQLQEIQRIAQTSTKFGPGSSAKYNWEGIANAIPGFNLSTDDTSNYQELNKAFNRISATSNIATNGNGTDQHLAASQAAYPGPDMTNKAILNIVPKLIAQENAGIVNANFRAQARKVGEKSGNVTAALQDAEQQWRSANMKVFELNGMSPQDRRAAIAAMPPADRAALIKDTQTAAKNGWIQ